ncbi:hypothetical protein BDM02DRAFT_3186141 [Thelephora ganbajun]|uniref:Uncharacterized protein n=1 Tax=Thelephora ganbajun TaxID=370292 RepID=A0ACB6ZJ72_THEGA|nr:hypothetical protein BDM02DRAFT_3186141 [Thelephora ganbajun]
MVHDPPPLALSDIMHSFTPSPGHEGEVDEDQDRAHPEAYRTVSPEPLDQTEIDSIKSRLLQLGIGTSPEPGLSTRERELGDMLLRFTTSVRSDSSQLVAQAETIHQLAQQRDQLLRQTQEEKLRWDAERDLWVRTSEALLTKRRADVEALHPEETESKISYYESENKALRVKVADLQNRLTLMEAEVMSLRTVLKLSASSHVRSTATAPQKQHPGRPPRKHEVPVQRSSQNAIKGKGKEVETFRSDEEIDELIDDDDAPAGETPRVAKLQGSKSKGKARVVYEKGTPLMTDARAEHVLLAAKKLGRERVGQLSGMTPRDGRRVSTGQEPPSSSTPHTPRRPSRNTPVASQTHYHQDRYPYMGSPAVGYLFPVGAGSWPQPQTPLVRRDPSGSANPQTPFDDLVSVASRMLDEETPARISPNKRSRRLADESDSPLPRKRRASNDQDIGRKTSTLGPQRSALDVLADQATKEFDSETSRSAFDSGDERGATETGSPRRRNGRGTAVRELTARNTADNLDRPVALHPSGTAETSSRPGMTPPAPPRRASGDYPPLAPAPTINSRTRSQSSVTGERHPGSSPRVVSYPKPLLAAPYPRLSAAPHHPPLDLAQGVYGDPRYALFGQGYPLGMGYGMSPHQYPPPDYNSSRGAKVSIDGTSPPKKKRADDKRAKTPYKKWSKEEDEVLAQAVAKYGQKWDQVQKALPQRGYHQVRQRWLRRLRTMENSKVAEAGSNSVGGAATGQTVNGNGEANPDPCTIPNPKLGMAPLSSELAVAAASSNVPAESLQTSNPPQPAPLQSTDPQNIRTSTPPTVGSPRTDPATTDPTQAPTISVPSEPEQVPQAQPSSLSDTIPLPPDPTPTVALTEQPHPLPNKKPGPSDSPPTDPPADVDSRPPNIDNAPKEMS